MGDEEDYSSDSYLREAAPVRSVKPQEDAPAGPQLGGAAAAAKRLRTSRSDQEVEPDSFWDEVNRPPGLR